MDDAAQTVSHTITLESPATGSLTFGIAVKQTCLMITVYCSDSSATGITDAKQTPDSEKVRKYMRQGKILIDKNGCTYNAFGIRQ